MDSLMTMTLHWITMPTEIDKDCSILDDDHDHYTAIDQEFSTSVQDYTVIDQAFSTPVLNDLREGTSAL
eukprot:Awhi_evm1s4968